MKKIVLMAVAGLLAAQVSYAQNQPAGTPKVQSGASVAPPEAKGNTKISGIVQDAASKAPIEFATVALESKATGKTINGAMTDGKGRFNVADVSPGDYRLKISFLGYEPQVVETVHVTAGKEEVHTGAVSLQPSAKALSEVTVVGEKPLIEDMVDRMVYNAEKDINPGATATDIMRKVPGLSVDLEGNVQLRGSSNIQVLIDNKPSAVMASSVADALQQIPADQIKAVEVITSPSAKYDAEGTAGIINIITKKESGLQGLVGSLAMAYGTLNSNASGNLSYRKNKLGLNSSLGYGLSDIRGENRIRSSYGPGSSLTSLYQQMKGNRESSFAFLQLGATYDISKSSYVAAGVRFSTPEVTLNTTQVNMSSFGSAPEKLNTRKGSNQFVGNNYDLNLNYTKSFAKRGQELAVLGLISKNKRDNSVFMNLSEDEELKQREQNFNDAYNEEVTAQVDYTHPIKEGQLLEVGTKAIWRYAESDYRFLLATPAASPFVLQPEQTDLFSYNQDVLASYAIYNFKLKNYSLKMGLRYEHTNVDGDFTSKGTRVEQDYQNLFPSLSILKNLKENQTVKFSYSKRIQRPQLSYLNPYENLSNPKNVVRGNPALDAELTDSYEVGYSTFFRSGASINGSLYWNQTNNAIQQVSTPYSGSDTDSVGRVNTTVDNIGRNSSYGLSLSGSAKFWEKGRVNTNMNLFYTSVKSKGLNLSNSGVMYNTNLNVSYGFGKGFTAQMAGEYNSPQVSLQGKTIGWYTYNFAVRKEVLNKKGDISFAVNNPFHKYIERERIIEAYNAENVLVLSQRNTWHYYLRQARVSFNYQFGKQDAKTKARRIKKVVNDDAKDGDDSALQ